MFDQLILATQTVHAISSRRLRRASFGGGVRSQFAFVMGGGWLCVVSLLVFVGQFEIDPARAADQTPARLTVPSGPLLERTEKTVREVFGSDVVGASTTADHLLLATKLFKSSQDSADDPAGRFVLLETAAQQASEAGDLDLLLRIEQDKTNVFDIPKYPELLTTLKQFQERSENGRVVPPLVETSLRIAQVAEAEDDFPSAITFARFALDVVKDKDEHAKLKEQVIAAGKKLVANQKAFAEFQTAVVSLKSDPKDSAAHTLVGKRMLFVKYDLTAWTHLVLGNDADLKSLAERELADVEEGAPQVALADAWWNLSQTREIPAEKTVCLRRAKHWYQKSTTTVIGLTKSKVEKRLSEIGSDVDVKSISIVSTTNASSSSATNGDTLPPDDLSSLVVKTAKDAERVASRSRLAKSALAVYEKMFNDPAVEFVEKDAAKPRLASWQKAAAQDLVRIGPKWLTKDSVAAVRDEERRLVKEATEDLIARRMADADKKFSEARSIDPDGIMVDFQLGLLLAVQQHDPNRSAASFEKCIIKRKARTDLSVEEKVNLAAALNNLAVSHIHIRKTTEAQLDWAKAIDVAKPSPEILQNLGRTFTGTKSGGIFFEGEERKKWDSLQAKAESLANQRGYNQGRGFLLMPFQNEGDEKTTGLIYAESPAGTMEIRTCLKCLGSGLVTCGNCTLGSIPGIKDEVMAAPGGNQIVIHKKVRLPCPRCKGKGKIDCNACVDGIDPALSNSKKPPN